MRLATYFVRWADLIVTVEGWMVHAAYCLGKRYRVLMLPYSHPDEWHPYGRTCRQDVAATAWQNTSGPAGEAPAALLPSQPRKQMLLSALRSLGGSGDFRAARVLRRALESEDREVRLAATEALGALPDEAVQGELISLLDDPSSAVRAAAARALLSRRQGRPGAVDLPEAQLMAHCLIGPANRNWAEIMLLGEAARAAVQIALQDDDPVVRREAGWVLQALNQRETLARPAPSAGASAGKIVRRLFGRQK